jgi:hypothetical protein
MNRNSRTLITLRGVGPVDRLAVTRPLDWTDWAGSAECPLAGRMIYRGGVTG